ncbi:MAG: polyprenyl synthetase family protein [Luteibaculaceae bacterium]
MITVSQIKAPVALELEEFELRFKSAMKSKTPLLDKITHYIIKRKGKQMRPMFVFLAAKTCGLVNDSSYNAASLIELLHTATLVHDDVVDDAYLRRGFFSINALWKNKIAVLVGDYLLSRGLLLSVENGEFKLLQIVSTAVKEMSEGELLQIEKSRKLDITEEVYYTIIKQKTASLIAACCAAGAASVNSSEVNINKMFKFGELVGMSFQIKDDLFDFGYNQDKIGKPTGIDIKEKKLTLPLIKALEQTDAKERKEILNLIKNSSESNKTVKKVTEFVTQSNGLQYAYNRMIQFKDEAIAILHTFPESDARDSLENLVEYSVKREK